MSSERLIGAFTTDGTKVATQGIDRIPPFDPRSGDHLWITTACWRVDPDRWLNPGGDPVHLDTINGTVIPATSVLAGARPRTACVAVPPPPPERPRQAELRSCLGCCSPTDHPERRCDKCRTNP